MVVPERSDGPVASVGDPALTGNRRKTNETGGDRKEKLQDLKDRTRELALRTIKLYSALPRKAECLIIGKQLLRSGRSVGANYREGLRARSRSEYAAKLNTGLMELEEILYWLELLEGCGALAARRLAPRKGEISELSAIFVTLIKRARTQVNKPETTNQKPDDSPKTV
jgi:four helix bundle protein